MRVALYARTTAADRDSVDHILAGLNAQAARRGWEIALECADPGSSHQGRREGLRRLTAAVRAKAVQAVLVPSLSHLARSLRHLADLGRLLAAQDIALVAFEDGLDTTDLAGALRWSDWLDIAGRLTAQHRAEAAKLAHLTAPGETWGRPPAAINPLELLTWWEGRGGRRPATLRALAAKLGTSEKTVRSRLQALRNAGQVNDTARQRALATRGARRKGGRPANPLDDTTLAALWEKSPRRGAAPSIATLARHLHVSRNRLQERLRQLGLLKNIPPTAEPSPGIPPTRKKFSADHK